MSGAPGRKLVRASIAARRLGVSVRTVRRWIAIGSLEGVHVESFRDGRGHWYAFSDALDAFVR